MSSRTTLLGVVWLLTFSLAPDSGAQQAGEMKPYVLGLLRRGDSAESFSPEQLQELQRGHMARIQSLSESGQLVLAGPFEGGGELRGLFIYDVETLEQAQALADSDPAVQAGRLSVDLLRWWGSSVLADFPAMHRARFPKPTEAGAEVDPVPPGSGSPVEGGADVGPMVDAYLKAYQAADLTALGSLLHEQAVFEDPTQRVAGRQAVLDGLAAAFQAYRITGLQENSRLRSGSEHVLVDTTVTFEQDARALGLSGEPLRFELRLCLGLWFEEGRVIRHVDFVDSQAYSRQLGEQLQSRR